MYKKCIKGGISYLNQKLKGLLKSSLKGLSVFFAIIGYFALFIPFSEILSKYSLLEKFLISVSIVFMVLVCAFVFNCLRFSLTKKVTLFPVSDGHHVHVQYGDIFSDSIVINKTKRRNIIIPVNRCFDTIVDDNLVSSNTLHGKAIKTILSDSSQNIKGLDKKMSDSLKALCTETECLEKSEKPKGKLDRYPVGTTVEFSRNDKEMYFFLALSTFDKDLHAHTTQLEYMIALQSVLDYSIKRSQKYPVVMPLIGAGGSNTGITEEEILKFMLMWLKINKSRINCDFHIVIRDGAKLNIELKNLKEMLGE